MAVYEYACPRCGVFEVARPIGTAPPAADCRTCGGRSSRRFSIPALTGLRTAARTARELAERSAHEPAVVSHPPAPPRRRPRPPNPLHAKLPRP